MATTLIIRMSSLGDVAILIPVLYSVADRYPEDKFVLLTKKPLQTLFINKPSNLEISPAYTKSRHKGFVGLLRLIKELTSPPTPPHKGGESESQPPLPCGEGSGKRSVADLHNVLRSKLIDFSFRLKRAKVAVIDKGKKEKKMLTRRNNKQLSPLKSSLERYQKVFEDLGYDASLDFTSLFDSKDKKDEIRIGIAPFAKHPGKIYPFEQMEEVIRLLAGKPNTRIFLFGGREESERLGDWSKKYKQVESVAGQLPFSDELLLMNNLDVMVSMDSANMHLASLVQTPVVSIWGATHPYAGFYGFNQNPENAVQVNLECRPCSIFGNKPCLRGDYVCMKQITPEMIVEKVETLLNIIPAPIIVT